MAGRGGRPGRYGQTWDAAIDAHFGQVPVGPLIERYGDAPDVAGVAGMRYGELTIQGSAVPVVGIETLAGDFELTMLDGRAPAARGEVALGALSLEAIGASVGDDVTVATPEGDEEWRIVGTTVFPQLSLGSFSVLGLGTGGLVAPAALPSDVDRVELDEDLAAEGMGDEWQAEDFFLDGRTFNALLLRAAPGAGEELAARVAEDPAAVFGEQRTLQRPAAISTYADVRATPVVLAVVLATLAAALVAHVLVTSAHRRSRELATCRVFGMRRRDVATVVRWQATALAVVAALVGLPIGVAAGRVAWTVFADGLGVPATATIPWAWLVVATAATVVIANIAAAIPARRAAQLPPAVALRDE